MKVMGPAQTFTGPFPVVIRFLAPVIGGGVAATDAVLGDGRGLAHHSSEKKERRAGYPSSLSIGSPSVLASASVISSFGAIASMVPT